ncbi:hypothetical protein OHS33_36265 [Streptomyces sp. NBC_00536]|nr:hypothetical protein [Streptomyces sp. NBC_00536]WUC84065.1 hypothetical protein OHS33_36265 [Streptomyces sp. NBC_00536]
MAERLVEGIFTALDEQTVDLLSGFARDVKGLCDHGTTTWS